MWARNNLANIVIEHGKKEFLADAIAWALEAHALLPDAKTTRATLGRLLVEAGQYLEGRALLEPLTTPENDLIDRSIAACYLAKACHHLGDPARAADWLALADGIHACPAVHKRIQAEVTTAPTPPSFSIGSPSADAMARHDSTA